MAEQEPEAEKHPRAYQKWNGWGYQDSKFQLRSDRFVEFTGARYAISGQVFPKLADWFVNECNANLDFTSPSQPLPRQEDLPKPNINEQFLASVQGSDFEYSLHPHERLFRSHGHTCHEIYHLRHGVISRIPDIVVWPRNHKEVEQIVLAANDSGVCIIPFGGGTSVSSALECPNNEHRMIVSLDMTKMNKILWVDYENMTMCAEAGIIGEELEKQVRRILGLR